MIILCLLNLISVVISAVKITSTLVKMLTHIYSQVLFSQFYMSGMEGKKKKKTLLSDASLDS